MLALPRPTPAQPPRPLPLVASPTELSTAATDALLAIECMAVAAWIRRTPGGPRWRATLWAATLALLAVASLLGAAAHGLALTQTLRATLWTPIYLLLGIVVGLMGAGAMGDLAGSASLRRWLPRVVVLALAFVALSEVAGGDYWVFVLFQGAAALFTLAIYAAVARRHGVPGAWTVVAALAMSLVAGAVQASRWTLAPAVPIDHNGLYHLLTMVNVAILGRGIVDGQRPRPPKADP
jgi:hypothetical protein